ncbi:MAG: hypothetical protein WC438_04980 [Candidatus Pacearchaeota archaeon]
MAEEIPISDELRKYGALVKLVQIYENDIASTPHSVYSAAGMYIEITQILSDFQIKNRTKLQYEGLTQMLFDRLDTALVDFMKKK